MNQSKERVWGPRQGKTVLILFFVIAIVAAAGIWISTSATGPSSADVGTIASHGITTAASKPSASSPAKQDGKHSAPAIPSAASKPSASSPAKEDGKHSAPAIPPAVVPEHRALPPSEASAKATEDAAQALIQQPIAAPLELSATSKPEAGVTATVGTIEAVKGEGQGPGQISGPAIRFTITLANGGTTPILTDKAVVNVESGVDSAPAIQLSGPGTVPFPENTMPGEKSTGTFVFLLPNDQRDQVRIFFNYQVSSPIVAFEGAVPKAK